ncbi:MAG: NAD-dependent epimerase/dehydratase family protein [Bacillota bacterium]
MNLFSKNEFYTSDLYSLINIDIPWNKMRNKCILITGATGLIGSFLIDLLMFRNEHFNENINILAICRSRTKALKRFGEYIKNKNFFVWEQDVCEKIKTDIKVDYIIHGASNADPQTFSKDPVGTMLANFIGMSNLLEFARNHNVVRTLFLSTGEVYGETNEEAISEDTCGYVDFNSSRSCYPESKRAAETLCSSYIAQYGIDITIARLCYIYGPTMTDKDSRVIAQFIRNTLANEDIVMKSEGAQLRSYCYISDAVSALLYILLLGNTGSAYNIANKNSNVTIRQIAETLSEIYNLGIRFEIPEVTEKKGYSKVQRAVLNTEKLENLGWNPTVNLKDGLKKTLSIIKAST